MLKIALAFAHMEAAISEHFLPAILDEQAENLQVFSGLMGLPTKHSSLGLLDPIQTASDKFNTSQESTVFLILALICLSHFQ
jgi:hypothetical protein